MESFCWIVAAPGLVRGRNSGGDTVHQDSCFFWPALARAWAHHAKAETHHPCFQEVTVESDHGLKCSTHNLSAVVHGTTLHIMSCDSNHSLEGYCTRRKIGLEATTASLLPLGILPPAFVRYFFHCNSPIAISIAEVSTEEVRQHPLASRHCAARKWRKRGIVPLE